MPTMLDRLLAIAKEAALETMWPTRCAICDAPGDLICPSCLAALPRIEQLKACPRCGSPYGVIQCCDCSPCLLEPVGRTEPPYDSCRSALLMDEVSGHIITVFKDAGERRLSLPIAHLMLQACPRETLAVADACTFIPCSNGAFRRRGFDHAELIAQAFSRESGIPLIRCFERPDSFDQRALTRRQRFANMQTAIRTLPDADADAAGSIILLDDAYTTGATMFAATDALRDLGVRRIDGLTFARA